jgi:hypothetical protein
MTNLRRRPVKWLMAFIMSTALCLVAVSCNVQDYSSNPSKPCPKGYVRVHVSHHSPTSWACYKVIQ